VITKIKIAKLFLHSLASFILSYKKSLVVKRKAIILPTFLLLLRPMLYYKTSTKIRCTILYGETTR